MNTEVLIRQNDGIINELEAAMLENLPVVDCPLVHRFTEGMYIREIFMPQGTLITSKVHLTNHPFTISKGKVKVSIDGGEWAEYEAPYTGITKAGTRRILFIVEDCVWSTYHLNIDNCEDVDTLVERLVEKHDNPLLENIKNIDL